MGRESPDPSSNPLLQPQPELFRFPGMAADAVGTRLQSSMIWAGPETDDEPVAVTFRKTFPLEKVPDRASLSIFADARYILWVNGRYVERGPGRFQPNGPEYDVLEIAPHLGEGTNALAVLVLGNLSTGKIMRHVGPVSDRQILIEPHLGDLHEAEGVVVTEFGPVPISWRIAEGELHFQGTIPADTKARLSLPSTSSLDEILLNGKSLRGVPTGKRLSLDLKPGNFSGIHKFMHPVSLTSIVATISVSRTAATHP